MGLDKWSLLWTDFEKERHGCSNGACLLEETIVVIETRLGAYEGVMRLKTLHIIIGCQIDLFGEVGEVGGDDDVVSRFEDVFIYRFEQVACVEFDSARDIVTLGVFLGDI